MFLQRLRDPCVQLLTLVTQQRAVGDILNQRVLEQIRGARRRATTEKQAGVRQLSERHAQLRVPAAGDSSEQFVGKLATKRGAHLGHLLDSMQPIEPGQQQSLEARRNGQRWYRAGEYVGVILFEQQSAFEYTVCQFFDKQRDAISALDNAVQDVGWQVLAGGDAVDHCCYIAACEPVQRQR